MNEVLIHIRFSISSVTKNVLNMANSADPDESPHFAVSHLGLRIYKYSFFNFMHNNRVHAIAYNDFR